MTWTNTTRVNRKARNRRHWHEQRIAAARTDRARLWAACGWLVSEAWKAGLLDEAKTWVIEKVREIRGEEEDDDRNDDRERDYAA